MKFLINREGLLNLAMLLFALFPLIPNRFKGLPVILLILMSIINYKYHKINYKWFLINSSFFFLFLISFIYTENISYGVKKIETALSVLFIPFCFFIVLPDKKIENWLKLSFMKLFIISTTFFSIITLICIFINNKTEYYKDFYSNKYRIVVEELPLIGQHPIYASIFFGIALIFVFFLFKNKNIVFNSNSYLYIISAIINLSLIIMLSSRAVILSLIVLVLLYLTRTIIKNKNYKYLFRTIALLGISIALLFIFNRRMKEMIRFDTYSKVNSNYSNSFRVNIYECAFKVVKKSVLFGYGIGDAQDQLDSCYNEADNLLLLKKKYNSHNQYLDFTIKLGLLGLFSFLLFLLYNVYKSYFSKNDILFYIILFYCINFLTENIMVRQSGLIPFIFFIHFFRIEIKSIN